MTSRVKTVQDTFHSTYSISMATSSVVSLSPQWRWGGFVVPLDCQSCWGGGVVVWGCGGALRSGGGAGELFTLAGLRVRPVVHFQLGHRP